MPRIFGMGAAIWALASWGCMPVSIGLEGLACDDGTCLPGYRCDEETQWCVADTGAGDRSAAGDPTGDGSAGDASGDPSAGDGAAGDGAAGDGAAGDPPAGDGAAGDPRPGDPAAGDPRPGDPRPGDPRPGDPRPGDPRPGDPRPGDPLLGCPWWSAAYGYRQEITVTNNAASVMPSGYSVVVQVDHAALVPSKSRVNGNDLRIVTCDGTELDRVDASPLSTGSGASSFAGSATQLYFATTTPIATGASDTYYLYYGRPSALAPPADPARVFDFWEPFDSLAAWTVVGTPGASVSGGALDVDALNPGDVLYITGAAGARSGSSGFAVRARVLQLNLGNDLGAVGWHYDIGTGLRYDISASGSLNRIRYWGVADNVTANLFSDGGNLPAADTWYVYEATVVGPDFGFRRDGTVLGTASGSQLSSGQVHLDGECLTARWDWLLIRHFLSPEPTVTLGSEESR